jgi:hypothetical protein
MLDMYDAQFQYEGDTSFDPYHGTKLVIGPTPLDTLGKPFPAESGGSQNTFYGPVVLDFIDSEDEEDEEDEESEEESGEEESEEEESESEEEEDYFLWGGSSSINQVYQVFVDV